MSAISTRNARVVVSDIEQNGAAVITLLSTHWTVEVRSDEIDVTNFETGGFAQYLPGYVDASISVDGFYEPGGSPFGFNGIPLIMSGNFVTLTLYMTRTGLTDYFFFNKAFVLTASGSSAVRDAARVSFTARNFGTFDYPGGITFSGVEPV